MKDTEMRVYHNIHFLLFIWFVIFDFLLHLCFLTCDFTYLLFAQFCSPRVFFFVAFSIFFIGTGSSFVSLIPIFASLIFFYPSRVKISCRSFLFLFIYFHFTIRFICSNNVFLFFSTTSHPQKRPQYLTACVPMWLLILLYLLSAIVSHRYLSHDYSICLKP